jgi:hypothetical protein
MFISQCTPAILAEYSELFSSFRDRFERVDLMKGFRNVKKSKRSANYLNRKIN